MSIFNHLKSYATMSFEQISIFFFLYIGDWTHAHFLRHHVAELKKGRLSSTLMHDFVTMILLEMSFFYRAFGTFVCFGIASFANKVVKKKKNCFMFELVETIYWMDLLGHGLAKLEIRWMHNSIFTETCLLQWVTQVIMGLILAKLKFVQT